MPAVPAGPFAGAQDASIFAPREPAAFAEEERLEQGPKLPAGPFAAQQEAWIASPAYFAVRRAHVSTLECVQGVRVLAQCAGNL